MAADEIGFTGYPLNKASTEVVPVDIAGNIFKKYGITQDNPDKILAQKGVMIYDTMKHEDEKISSQLRTRASETNSLPWEIQAASDDPQDIKIRDSVINVLNNIKGTFSSTIGDMLTAPQHGFKLLEIIWNDEPFVGGEFAGQWGLKAIKSKPSSQLDFDTDKYNNVLGVKLSRRARRALNISDDDSFDYRKFIHVVFESQNGNPYGTSILRELFWKYYFKKNGWKFFAVYVERFATPLTVLTHALKSERGNLKAEEKEYIASLLSMLDSIGNSAGILLGENEKIEFAKALAGGEKAFRSFIADCEAAISQSITGQVLATSQGDRTGANSLGQTHKKQLVKAGETDQNMIEFALNDSIHAIIKQIVDVNYIGVVNYPKFKFIPKDTEEVDSKIKRVKTGFEINLPMSKEQIYRELNLTPPKDDDDLLDTMPAQQQEEDDESLNFAASTNSALKILVKDRDREVEDIIATHGRNMVASEIINLRDEVVRRVEKKKIIEKGDLSKLEGFADFVNLKGTSEAFLNAWLYAFLAGKESALTYAKSRGIDPDVAQLALETFDANAIFNRFKQQTPITKAEFNLIKENLRPDSTAIANIEREKIVADIQSSLHSTMINNKTLADFRQLLGEKLSRYTGTISGGIESIGAEITPWHAETIFRTNMLRTYSEGQESVWNDPLVGNFIVGYEYIVIKDDRLRPSHLALKGVTRPKNDIVWTKLQFPVDYNCRCGKRPIFITDPNPKFTPAAEAIRLADQVGFGKG